MKQLLFFFFYIIFFVAARGQRNYIEAMHQGDDAFNNGQYKIAINKYFAAEAFDPTKKDSVKAKVNRAFDAIETLRSEAVKAKRDAIQSQLAASYALGKAQKFMKAFYFYDNKYALILKRNPEKDEKFVFINREGNEVFKDRYEKAEAFEDPGFAKAQIWEGKYGECCNSVSDYLIDTTGKTYRVLYQLDTFAHYANLYMSGFNISREIKLDSIPWGVNALDLRQKKIDSLPLMPGLSKLELLLLSDSVTKVPTGIGNLIGLKSMYINHAYLLELSPEVAQLKNLQTLNLFGNRLKVLPPEIVQLNNLQILNLGQNQLTNLPRELGELKKLTTLVLSENNIPSSDIEKIKKLLPHCKVYK